MYDRCRVASAPVLERCGDILHVFVVICQRTNFKFRVKKQWSAHQHLIQLLRGICVDDADVTTAARKRVDAIDNSPLDGVRYPLFLSRITLPVGIIPLLTRGLRIIKTS